MLYASADETLPSRRCSPSLLGRHGHFLSFPYAPPSGFFEPTFFPYATTEGFPPEWPVVKPSLLARQCYISAALSHLLALYAPSSRTRSFRFSLLLLVHVLTLQPVGVLIFNCSSSPYHPVTHRLDMNRISIAPSRPLRPQHPRFLFSIPFCHGLSRHLLFPCDTN